MPRREPWGCLRQLRSASSDRASCAPPCWSSPTWSSGSRDTPSASAVMERRLIAVLAGTLDVGLPVPAAADLSPPLDRCFAAHKLVAGTVVDESLLASLPAGEVDDLLTQLGHFLDQLSRATAAATAAGVPHRSLAELAAEWQDQVSELLGPRLERRAVLRATSELEALARVDCGARVLCHTDLGGNLVWDRAGGRLGVIDWGAAQVSDPVLDLASLAALDEGVAVAVGERVAHLRHRHVDALAVRETFRLQEALYAARQEEWGQVDQVLKGY